MKGVPAVKGKYWLILLAVLLAFLAGLALGRGSLLLGNTLLQGTHTGTSAGEIHLSGPQTEGPDSARIDLNTATAAQLQELPGVGEVLAQNILALRQKLGGFTAVFQLLEAEGLGPAVYDKIKNLVYIGEN